MRRLQLRMGKKIIALQSAAPAMLWTRGPEADQTRCFKIFLSGPNDGLLCKFLLFGG